MPRVLEGRGIRRRAAQEGAVQERVRRACNKQPPHVEVVVVAVRAVAASGVAVRQVMSRRASGPTARSIGAPVTGTSRYAGGQKSREERGSEGGV